MSNTPFEDIEQSKVPAKHGRGQVPFVPQTPSWERTSAYQRQGTHPAAQEAGLIASSWSPGRESNSLADDCHSSGLTNRATGTPAELLFPKFRRLERLENVLTRCSS